MQDKTQHDPSFQVFLAFHIVNLCVSVGVLIYSFKIGGTTVC